MSIDIGAGASADAGPIDVGASIAFHLGSLAESEKRRQDRADRRAQAAPADVPLRAAGLFPASGALLLDLGSVPQGHVWQVRRVIVGGTLVTSSPAGAAYLYASGQSPAQLVTADCVDIFPTLPAGADYGTHQLYLVSGEHLWMAVNGGTNGTQYVASARVEDWLFGDYFASNYSE